MPGGGAGDCPARRRARCVRPLQVERDMGEANHNVWAPWRMQYIESLAGRDEQGCFLCEHCRTPQDDARNHVVWRSDKTLVVLNRFPYSSGHLLIAPVAHAVQFETLPEDVLLELMQRMQAAKRVLEHALHAQGFNIGLNLSHCAGAGLPDHLHWHVVPRWAGDTNFMAVVGDVKVIPEALDRTYERIRAAAVELGL
jgi:ATP adenylyltransferase